MTIGPARRAAGPGRGRQHHRRDGSANVNVIFVCIEVLMVLCLVLVLCLHKRFLAAGETLASKPGACQRVVATLMPWTLISPTESCEIILTFE